MRLSELETRIPPLIVLAACAALAWACAAALPGRPLEWPLQGLLAALLLVCGESREAQHTGDFENPPIGPPNEKGHREGGLSL